MSALEIEMELTDLANGSRLRIHYEYAPELREISTRDMEISIVAARLDAEEEPWETALYFDQSEAEKLRDALNLVIDRMVADKARHGA